MKYSVNYVASLSDLAVIEITGADAGSFLHGQLTHDVVNLGAEQARFAGYCTAKGRLLGSLVFWHEENVEPPTIHALVKADIAEALVKRLSMFVLRAKAKLRITDLRVQGLSIKWTNAPDTSSVEPDNTSAPGLALLPQFDLNTLPVQPPSGTVRRIAGITCIAAPSADPLQDRWWIIAAPADASADPSMQHSAESGPADAEARWQAADIAAGLPWVVAATQDVFIPQTLNLDLIDGVSFTKGCYPGQEVVARSHYRGTVKRRMAYGTVSEASAQPAGSLPGIDIFDANKPNSPCGRVINSARAQNTHLLLEIQLSDLETADFRLGEPGGPAITLQALPYAITVNDQD